MQIEMSTTIGELAKALAAAQGELTPAIKDAVNPHFRSKYADLGAVWDACRVPLAAHGLSVSQWPGPFADGCASLVTVLAHASGEWVRYGMTIPVAKSDPQGYGSAITYARRYSLAAVVGVYQDDDDANAATAKPKQERKRVEAQPAPNGNGHDATETAQRVLGGEECISEGQRKRLYALMKEGGHGADEVKAWLASEYGITSSTAIPKTKYDAICEAVGNPGPLN